jgi:SAM-dependent methyltransferase
MATKNSARTKASARKKPTPTPLKPIAHDPYYSDAALYERNFAHKTEDIAFYLDLAEECGGPILEYGAGAGRVTLPLAEAGYEVTAVDLSPSMLALLETRLARRDATVQRRVRRIEADMTKRGNLGKFPLVLATFNVVGHLHTFEAMARFLARVKEHLEPGGTLVFDVPVPAAEELSADPDEVFKAPRQKHPTTGQWIREEERFAYDAVSQVLTVESALYVEGFKDPLTIPLRLRQWFPRELEALLNYEGFREVQLLADYTFEPALADVDMLVVRALAP